MFINYLKLLLLLIISSNSSFIWGQPQHLVDSLEIELLETNNSHERKLILAQLTKLHLRPNPQKALQYLKRRLYLTHKDSLINQASIYNEIGIVYTKMDSALIAISYLKKAFNIYDHNDKIEGLATTNLWLAYCYRDMQQYDQALGHAYRALELYESVDSKQNISSIYTLLSGINYVTRDFQELLINSKKALASSTNKANSILFSNVTRAYMNLIGMDTSRNYSNSTALLDSAIYYAQTALKIDEQNEDKNSIAINYRLLTDLYLAQKKPQLAINSINKVLGMEKHLLLPVSKVEVQNTLAFVYTEIKDYQKSIAIYQQALAAAIDLGAFDRALISQQGIAKNYVKLGNFEKAYQNLRKAFPIRDSILQKAKHEQIKSLEIKHQTKYETHKKEQENKLLAKDLAIQKLMIVQSKQQFYGLLVLFVLGGIISYLILRQYKTKSTQQMLELKHRLLRNQMNPHFIFNAMVAIQNFVYKNDPRKAGKYLSSFAKLVRAILDNSRNEYISLSKEIQWLENYLNLQLLRFNNKFDFDIQIDDALNLESVLIPPMLTQPFIENALEHGIKSINYQGKLIVQFSLKNDLLMVTVQDNGIGLSTSNQAPKKEKHISLATTITKERLDFLNKKSKKKIHLEMTSIKPSGTLVSFSIPLNYIY